MKLRLLIICLIIITASGCAATGKNFTEYQSHLSKVSEGQSRIYVYRTSESMQYSGRSVDIKLDGAQKGMCDYKGFNIFDVPAGTHQLQVDMWDSPGTCTITTNLTNQGEYFFEIEPRSGNLAGILLGGIVGAAIESSGKSCGGSFSIVEIAPNIASEKIKVLNLTK